MKSTATKQKKQVVPAWAVEQIEAERTRCHIAPHVALDMARNACSVCGSIVVMHNAAIGGGVACVCCGAHGSHRSKHWAGNMEAFPQPTTERTTRHYEYGTHGTSCNPVSDALGGF